MEFNSNTIQLLSIGVGFGLVFFSDIFPEEIRGWFKIIGFIIVFAPALQEFVMPLISAENTCWHTIVRNNGAEFYGYEHGASKDVVDTKSNPPVYTRTIESRFACEMEGADDQYIEYYGKFRKFQLQSDKGPIEKRIKASQRFAWLLGAYFKHRAVIKVIVEDVMTSGSEEYKGERIPTFNIVEVIQGDYENNTPMGKSLMITVPKSPRLTALIKQIIAKNKRLSTSLAQLRIRLKNASSERLKHEMGKDAKEATIGGMLKNQRDAITEGKLYANHRYRQEREWKKVSGGSVEKFPKWIIPLILGFATIIGIVYIIFGNPQTVMWMGQAQNQVFLIVGLALIVILAYLVSRRLKK